ncbi:hypothetical protein SDRG_16681 [Saprolegnia diclina VS20]|uniref:Uncharacterized protein n=1 Tax=Saprolegnia diclina (strain VS20) TaxID=1156394 RepID=T0R7L7_SAPDV|nr:hypothetical protein SDRG_16681 [Saprolegnia diclina VS20]EQC25462.1 hypothetical protein SDRG_16681 [Saprolegnia diclina VS20]|eukprot:XP_008621121.1 hypothetical protein SDRG_16681 [Saprolegnia diclina VS20]
MAPSKRILKTCTGNVGPTVDFLYHSTLLVFWLRARSLEALGYGRALTRLQSLLDTGDEGAADALLGRMSAFTEAPTVSQLAAALEAAATLGEGAHEMVVQVRTGTVISDRCPYQLMCMDGRLARWVCNSVVPDLNAANVVQLAAAAPTAAKTLLLKINTSLVRLPLDSLIALHDLDAAGHLPFGRFLHLVEMAALSKTDMAARDTRVMTTAEPKPSTTCKTPALRPLNRAHLAAIAAILLSKPRAAPVFVHSHCQSADESFVPLVLEAAWHLAETPMYADLVRHRPSLLPDVDDQPPVELWCQPNAHLPAYPRVEAFLRDPKRETTEHGFSNTGIYFAATYFGPSINATSDASSEATPFRAGKAACCSIAKTTAFYAVALETWTKRRDEASACTRL